MTEPSDEQEGQSQGLTRRDLLKKAGVGVAAAGLAAGPARYAFAGQLAFVPDRPGGQF